MMSSWRDIGDHERAGFGKRTYTFASPNGNYQLTIDELDQGYVYAKMGVETLRWGLEVKRECNGIFALSGMTWGTDKFLGDLYWYELTLSSPAVIKYWGVDILFRQDCEYQSG